MCPFLLLITPATPRTPSLRAPGKRLGPVAMMPSVPKPRKRASPNGNPPKAPAPNPNGHCCTQCGTQVGRPIVLTLCTRTAYAAYRTWLTQCMCRRIAKAVPTYVGYTV